MSLRSKTFLVHKGDTLNTVSDFIRREIGLDSYLIKGIRAVARSDITEVTLLYNKYPDVIVDSFAPREGAIFTNDIASNTFDVRILFNSPIDSQSIQSGTFKIDGVDLDTGRILLDSNSNNYYVKLLASGAAFQSNDFHTYQVGSALKRLDGSDLPYTPVGGYLFHTLSSAHIGDYTRDYTDRRRGVVVAGLVRLSKGLNSQQGILEYISQFQIASQDRIIDYTTLALGNGQIDVYFLYLSKLEPQIVSGFPLNNSLLPSVSAPGKVTLVFNTELDKTTLTTTDGLFTIESDFSTSTEVLAADVTVLDDLRTVEINTSSYFTTNKIYSIIARPGIKAIDGMSKEKPEQWTIHVSAYEPGAGGGTGNFSGVDPTGGLYQNAQFEIGIRPGFGFTLPGSPGGGITINLGTGLSGNGTGGSINLVIDNSTLGYNTTTKTVSIADRGITELQIAYNAISGGHILANEVVKSIVIGETPLYDNIFLSGRGNTTLTKQGDVTYFSGVPVADDTSYTYLSGQHVSHTGNVSNPHSVTTTQIGAATTAQYVYISGEHVSHTGNTSNPHSVTTTQIGAATTTQYNFLSGQHSTLTGQVSGHLVGTDPHTQYVIKDPLTSTRNEIAPTDGSIPGLIISDTNYGGAPANDFFQIHISTTPTSWIDATGHFNSLMEPTIGRHLTTKTYVDSVAGGVSQAAYDYLSGQHTAHSGNLSNPHQVTAAQVGSPTTANFAFLSGELNTHSGNLTNPHQVTAAQVGSPTTANFSYLSGQHTAHSGSLSNPHQVTAAQVGSPTTANFSYLSGQHTSHTGTATIHFTTGQIDHTRIGSLTVGDPHTQYTYLFPSSSTRNVITPIGDFVALTIQDGTEGGGGGSDIFVVERSDKTIKHLWVDSNGDASVDQWPSSSGHIACKQYVDNAVGGVDLTALQVANNLSDVANKDKARANIGIWEMEDFTPLDNNLWTVLAGGGGSRYQWSPHWDPHWMQSGGVEGVLAIDPGSSTGTGNSAIVYTSNRGWFLSSGQIFYFKVGLNNNTQAEYRIGVFYDPPSVAGMQPSQGCWFRFADVGTGSTVFTIEASRNPGDSLFSGLVLSNMTPVYDYWYWFGIECRGPDVYYYAISGDIISTGVLLNAAPTGQERWCRPFMQAINQAAATRLLYVDKILNYSTANNFSGLNIPVLAGGL